MDRVILAHDSLTQSGGAERVLDAMHEAYPTAPVLVLVQDKKMARKYTEWDVRITILQKLYDRFPKFQYLLPFIPLAAGSYHVPPCEVLLSSSSGFIKGLRKPRGSVHINYCHTPTRFLWSEPEYAKQEVPAMLRPFAAAFLRWMRRWDFRVAQRIDHFIANSKEVQQRIASYYKRDSTVIYPFIDAEFFHPTVAKRNYFLSGGRLQAHKGNELVIEAFNRLGWELHIVGIGRQEKFLRSIATPNVKFLGRITDEQLRDEYSGAQGFIFPPLEDLGLMPLEAAACGTATLGFARGGSLETIVPGRTGELFERQTVDDIVNALREWNGALYSTVNLRAHAEKFNKKRFLRELTDFVNENSG